MTEFFIYFTLYSIIIVGFLSLIGYKWYLVSRLEKLEKECKNLRDELRETTSELSERLAIDEAVSTALQQFEYAQNPEEWPESEEDLN